MNTVHLYDLLTLSIFGFLQEYGSRIIDFSKPVFIEEIKDEERYLIKNSNRTFWLNMADIDHPLTKANIN